MKAKTIFVFCLLIPLLSIGQVTYKSFIHSGVTKWLYYSPQDGCMMDEVDAYGDTVINQLIYKKIWNVQFIPQPPYVNVNQQWREYSQFSGLTNIFMRQSNDSSKLYLFDGTNNVEYLIADMNLNVGDEFIFPKLGSDTVESILYKDGLKNIQFKRLNAAWDKLAVVEGVGPNRGFVNLIKGYGDYTNVLFCYSNNSYYVQNGTCGCIDTKTEYVKNDKYKVNITLDLIEVSFDDKAQRTWELFDTMGRQIHKSQIVNDQSVQISMSGCNNGVYLLRIYNYNSKAYKAIKLIF